jgi:hypothetical protein
VEVVLRGSKQTGCRKLYTGAWYDQTAHTAWPGAILYKADVNVRL